MVDIRAPTRRECLLCGRTEGFDDDAGAWRVLDDAVGEPFCLHSWDVTGQFVAVRE